MARIQHTTASDAFGLNATTSGTFNPYKFSQTQTYEHLRDNRQTRQRATGCGIFGLNATGSDAVQTRH
jgi:hypothetical protein